MDSEDSEEQECSDYDEVSFIAREYTWHTPTCISRRHVPYSTRSRQEILLVELTGVPNPDVVLQSKGPCSILVYIIMHMTVVVRFVT